MPEESESFCSRRKLCVCVFGGVVPLRARSDSLFFSISFSTEDDAPFHITHTSRLHSTQKGGAKRGFFRHCLSCHFVWLYRGNSSLVWLQHHSPYYDVAKMFTPRLDVKMVHVIFFCFTSCVSSTWWEEENRIIFRESNNTGLVHSSLKVCTTRGGVIKFVKRIPKRNYFLGHFYCGGGSALLKRWEGIRLPLSRNVQL